MSIKTNSTQDSLIGWGAAIDVNDLDPAKHLGALAYSKEDETIMFSDGTSWRAPIDQIIRTPAALPPTNYSQRATLRVTPFLTGASQRGNVFQKSLNFRIYKKNNLGAIVPVEIKLNNGTMVPVNTAFVIFPQVSDGAGGFEIDETGNPKITFTNMDESGLHPTPYENDSSEPQGVHPDYRIDFVTKSSVSLPSAWLEASEAFYWQPQYGGLDKDTIEGAVDQEALLSADGTFNLFSEWGDLFMQFFPEKLMQPSYLQKDNLTTFTLRVDPFQSSFNTTWKKTVWEFSRNASFLPAETTTVEFDGLNNTANYFDGTPLNEAFLPDTCADITDQVCRQQKIENQSTFDIRKYLEGQYTEDAPELDFESLISYYYRVKYVDSVDETSAWSTDSVDGTSYFRFKRPSDSFILKARVLDETVQTVIVLPIVTTGTVTIDWGDGNTSVASSGTGKKGFIGISDGQLNAAVPTEPFVHRYTQGRFEEGEEITITVTPSNADSGVLSFGHEPWYINEGAANEWAFVEWTRGVGDGNAIDSENCLYWLTGRTASVSVPVGNTQLVGIDSLGSKLKYFTVKECTQLVEVPEYLPDTVLSLHQTFKDIPNSTLSNVQYWDTKNVKSLKETFMNCTNFNADISYWNVHGVQSRWVDVENEVINPSGSDWDDLISQGTYHVGSFVGTFQDCKQFTSSLSRWNINALSNGQNMSRMFKGAGQFNSPLTSWDVSTVGSMAEMFAEAENFNGSINAWDLSAVGSVNSMFRNSKKFNQSIKGISWDACKDFRSMFEGAEEFNGAIEDWVFKASGSVEISKMFKNAYSFNRPIYFDFASGPATTGPTSLEEMFYCVPTATSTSSFNSPVTILNVADVESTKYMFRDAVDFNAPVIFHADNLVVGETTMDVLPDFDSCTTFEGMFYSARSFDQDLRMNITASTDVNMHAFVYNARKFGLEGTLYGLTGSFTDKPFLDTGNNVTNLQSFFSAAASFRQNDLNNWITTNVTNFAYMFNNADSFNSDISSWNTGNATTMQGMFVGANIFDQNISAWDVSNVTTMESMFRSAGAFNGGSAKTLHWDNATTGSISLVDASRMFESANISDCSVKLKFSPTGNVNCDSMFQLAKSFEGEGVDTWDMSRVTNMYEMFRNTNTFNQDLSGWRLNNVTDMQLAFYDSNAFVGTGIENWFRDRTSTATIASQYLFALCNNFNGNVDFTSTANAAASGYRLFNSLRQFFHNDTKFEGTGLSAWNNLDKFSTGSTRYTLEYVFYNNVAITQATWNTIDFDDWNLDSRLSGVDLSLVWTFGYTQIQDSNVYKLLGTGRNVDQLYYTFFNCPNFTGNNLNNWGTSGLYDLRGAFTGCGNLDVSKLSGWNASSVAYADRAFEGISGRMPNIGTNLNSWDLGNLRYAQYMFRYNTTMASFNPTRLFEDINGQPSLQFAQQMFNGCDALHPDLINSIGTWDIYSLPREGGVQPNYNILFNSLLAGCTITEGQYLGILQNFLTQARAADIAWAADPTTSVKPSVRIYFHAGTVGSNTQIEAAKDELATNYNWSIADGS